MKPTARNQAPATSYALALHGGAGPTPGRDYSRVEHHLEQLAIAGRSALASGASAVDVVCDLVSELESSGYYVAGKGSAPNSAGYVELDASVMDGYRRAAGAVAAVRDLVHPIAAARLVLAHSPHVLLTGIGAARFAQTHGLALVEEAHSYYQLPIGVTQEELRQSAGHGTVGAVARDQQGRLAAATSTGGTLGKLEGRVGDSPLIGSGTWADDHVAVSCTGLGEAFILAGGAHEVSARVRLAGETLQQALESLLAQVASAGGDGGVIAVNRVGEVAAAFNSAGMKRALVLPGEAPQVATFGSH